MKPTITIPTELFETVLTLAKCYTDRVKPFVGQFPSIKEAERLLKEHRVYSMDYTVPGTTAGSMNKLYGA